MLVSWAVPNRLPDSAPTGRSMEDIAGETLTGL